MDIKPIVGTAIGIGATALALESTRMLPKVTRTKTKGFRIKPASNKRIFKSGARLLVGGMLLGAAAKSIK
jgi:hypothetical protein